MEFTTRLRAAISSNPTLGTENDTDSRAAKGLTPALGKPRSRELEHTYLHRKLSFTPQFLTWRQEGFGDGLFLVHSPLLKES